MKLLRLPIIVRNRFMPLIDKDYANKKTKLRGGKCKKCGRCCRGCRHLDKQTNLCKIYTNRPVLCHKQFPLDRLDQKAWGVEKTCGYRFQA